ncbi:hypothetical protein [Sphingobium sp. BS19]|uniref:hypothetical protein n=1 Tax=Sphingobium sp. BS19 TaxID=3018973 RepID=UPI0022EFBCFD|nr:hypothetical protein [Sphingobium sp. BS19]GLI97403.1 hypothetical protein Sbs19_12210 [Sphingobium sp. BS19]
MKDLFASGHAVDIVLFIIVIEGIWLVARSGWDVSSAILRLGPGVLMLLAVRFALTDMPWYWVSAALLLSFPVHLADLRRRR